MSGSLQGRWPVRRFPDARDGREVPDGLRGLLAAAGTATVVVAGGVDPALVPDGTDVVPLHVDESALPRRNTPDPDRGAGPLDRLVVERNGATHLLLPASVESWFALSRTLGAYLCDAATLVARNAEGALWELPPEPQPGPPKIFCIGLMKTGTSSLHQALSEVGRASLHWGGGEAYQAVLRATASGRRVAELVGEEWDAYSDIETLSVRFDLADRQYPGSKFVLTVRDVDRWVESRRRHVERNRRNQVLDDYHGANLRMEEERWRADFELHERRVREYFAGRDDALLVMDITAGDGWEELAPFLGIAPPVTPFPRETVYGRDLGLPALCLARRADGGAALVEADVRRDVDGPVSEALRSVLGTPLPPNGADLDQMKPGDRPLACPGGGASGLVAEAAGGPVAVAGPIGADLGAADGELVAIDLPWSVRPREAHDPDRGRGALERLALERHRTGHLLLPSASAWWLARYPELAEHLGRHGSVLAANDGGIVWELPPAPVPGRPKVFGIGLPGTGEERLRRVLGDLGVSTANHRAAGQDVLASAVQGRRLLEVVGERPEGWCGVEELAVRFDLADRHYPGSKFVLTVTDVDSWVRRRRERAASTAAGRTDASPTDPAELTELEERWRREWAEHDERVRSWFADRDADLLVIDPEDPGAAERVAAFLGRTRAPAPRRAARTVVDAAPRGVARTTVRPLLGRVARRLHVHDALSRVAQRAGRR